MRRTLQHPARIVPFAFVCAIAVGTVVLMLPVSRAGEGHAPFVTALFTATSATCVTGLITVDTPTYWSPFGQATIMAMIQIGGFGIMTLATLLGVLVSRRLGLRNRLIAQAETRTLALGDVRAVLGRVAITMLAVEALVATILTARFAIGYDYPIGRAAWHGSFHAVSAFNNAGFALYSDNLIGFRSDAWMLVPICLAVITGGIGFPVLFELFREYRRPAAWSTHTRITVIGTGILLVLGFAAVLGYEWANPATLGPMGIPEKLLNAFVQSVMPRTAGFQTIDYATAELETIAVTTSLMFIGGGSAGTAGGIKVTTFFLLAYVIWSEVKGEDDVIVGRRRITESAQRQALTVALLGVAVVAAGTLALIASSNGLRFDQALFESASAFATVGLSMNITATLPSNAQLTLVILMFVGRVGTITVASALALGTRRRLYRYPEERPIVG
ncbi:TrkH family potassium uptake protein [Micromonospora sp. CPCC 205371]|nr:TrkH family potassium uptake protein [Micromonospora sp. CPCC 205371]